MLKNNITDQILDMQDIKEARQMIRAVVMQEIEILADIFEEELQKLPDDYIDKDTINTHQLSCKVISHLLFHLCKDVASLNETNV